ncbi:MAG: IS1182 family transposase [Acidobacteria bacterium]|nr:IS1182 family transposase [Acidobacteriota bacterium]
MAKSFRPDNVKQDLLLPPSLRDWLPEKHLAHFLVDVVESLDLGAIYSSYEEKDGRGQAAYAPPLMLRLLLYGYCTGTYSSRKIESKTYEDVAFRYLAADEHPDHDTLAEFRKRHLEALAALFVQVLQLCQKAGLVKLGHVAIDGSKIQANASKHKAMSYERMGETEKKLREEVEALLEQAAAVDAAEDEKYGKGQKEQDLPAELARRESRLEKIREAKAALEAEAKEKAEAEKAAVEAKLAQRAEQQAQSGKKVGGRKPQVPDPATAQPDPKAQRNFTDPESRIMPDGGHKGSFLQGYNTQIAVDGQAQIIVAAEVSQDTNDTQQLAPMLGKVEENTGSKPQAASADTGYWNSQQMADPRLQGVDLYIATGKQKHGDGGAEKQEPVAEGSSSLSLREQMKQKLNSEAGREVYRKRKEIVEPVFGQIKEGRGFRRFLLRGLRNVRAEWKLICLSHNVLKLFRSERIVQMA